MAIQMRIATYRLRFLDVATAGFPIKDIFLDAPFDAWEPYKKD
jgi:hypothetical protein